MTRINIVPTNELTDQHLIAEYREITMIPASLYRTLNSYNKGKYLHKRYKQIVNEMKLRGFKPDVNRTFPIDVFKDNGLYDDWIPTLEDYKVIRERIDEKIALKPEWYRKTNP